jgi:hypothetical protein
MQGGRLMVTVLQDGCTPAIVREYLQADHETADHAITLDEYRRDLATDTPPRPIRIVHARSGRTNRTRR